MYLGNLLLIIYQINTVAPIIIIPDRRITDAGDIRITDIGDTRITD